MLKLTRIVKSKIIFLIYLLFTSLAVHASFIESTIGTAVVNDATATLYNPAALILLKTPQLITLGSYATFRTHFNGSTVQSATGFAQQGSSSAQTQYYLPSLYMGMPTNNKLSIGFAVISNSFDREADSNSILRYSQSNNSTQGIDFVPAIGFKLNEMFSLGVGLNYSYAKFVLQPITGFPSLNIPDSQSRNDCHGTGFGGDAGVLIKPAQGTLIGFNYRSALTYRLSGKSIFNGTTEVVSNHYGFHFWTPARYVLSMNQFVTPTLGFITTVQYIQWGIFKNIHIHGIAAQIGAQSVILDASVPFRLHNSWLFTLGTHYRLSPKWIIRVAGTYNQSPGNARYQISTGDSVIFGGSMGYEMNKHIILDASYAHAFMKNQSIHVTTGRNIINGVNKGARDSVSLKLTLIS